MIRTKDRPEKDQAEKDRPMPKKTDADDRPEAQLLPVPDDPAALLSLDAVLNRCRGGDYPPMVMAALRDLVLDVIDAAAFNEKAKGKLVLTLSISTHGPGIVINANHDVKFPKRPDANALVFARKDGTLSLTDPQFEIKWRAPADPRGGRPFTDHDPDTGEVRDA